MFVLFKWLLWLCMPFTLALLGLAAVGLWLLWRRQARPALCVLLLDALLVAMSLPAVPTALGSMLERKFPSVALKDIPKADAIVVLGGGVGAAREGLPYPECYPASDRAVMAARLFHAGKAPLIIPTGEGAPEAEKPLLEAMRVPAAAILCEDAARDTAENASKTFALLRARGCKKVLVVTSAWHLPRTMMLFKASGMEFVPVGCDYEATLAALEAPRSPLWQKLPSQAAAQTGVYLKEWLGILFYSFRKPTEGQKEGLKDGGAEGRTTPPKRGDGPREEGRPQKDRRRPLLVFTPPFLAPSAPLLSVLGAS